MTPAPAADDVPSEDSEPPEGEDPAASIVRMIRDVFERHFGRGPRRARKSLKRERAWFKYWRQAIADGREACPSRENLEDIEDDVTSAYSKYELAVKRSRNSPGDYSEPFNKVCVSHRCFYSIVRVRFQSYPTLCRGT